MPCLLPCRLQHLELIRERAALGKDFDRRDSFAGGSGSGRQSPVNLLPGKAVRQLRSPVPDAPASTSCVAEGGRPAGAVSTSVSPQLDTQAAAFSSTDAAAVSAESSQASIQQQAASSTGPGTPAVGLLPCDVFNQLQGNSQSIAAAGLSAAPSSTKSTLKGARRRMAKARHRMQQPG